MSLVTPPPEAIARWHISAESWRWCAMGLLLMLPSLVMAPPNGLAWTSLAWITHAWPDEPWRLWSAAWVHGSAQHLYANLAATILVMALGVAIPVRHRATLAWAMAWPLGHAGLMVGAPELQQFGGLSGVLHAGVAVGAVHLLVGDRRQRHLGLLMSGGLVLKLLLEQAWVSPLQTSQDWDIRLAPVGHLTGALAGLLCAIALRPWRAPR